MNTKLKTHSGTKKRVKLTGTGKIKTRKTCKNHLLGNKSKRQKLFGRKSKGVILNDANKPRFKKLLTK